MWGSVPSVASGIRWGSWNVLPVDKGALLHTERQRRRWGSVSWVTGCAGGLGAGGGMLQASLWGPRAQGQGRGGEEDAIDQGAELGLLSRRTAQAPRSAGETLLPPTPPRPSLVPTEAEARRGACKHTGFNPRSTLSARTRCRSRLRLRGGAWLPVARTCRTAKLASGSSHSGRRNPLGGRKGCWHRGARPPHPRACCSPLCGFARPPAPLCLSFLLCNMGSTAGLCQGEGD